MFQKNGDDATTVCVCLLKKRSKRASSVSKARPFVLDYRVIVAAPDADAGSMPAPTGGAPPSQMAKTPADLRSLARSYTEMGVRVLAGIANAEEQPASARVAAVTALFDRGWGKALQPHVGHEGNEIRVTIRQILESVDKEEPLLLEHETPEK
jgi:hypothetical protein